MSLYLNYKFIYSSRHIKTNKHKSYATIDAHHVKTSSTEAWNWNRKFVDLKRGKLQEWLESTRNFQKWQASKKSNLASKHTFVALNLMIYWSFYASMLSSFEFFCQKKGGETKQSQIWKCQMPATHFMCQIHVDVFFSYLSMSLKVCCKYGFFGLNLVIFSQRGDLLKG